MVSMPVLTPVRTEVNGAECLMVVAEERTLAYGMVFTMVVVVTPAERREVSTVHGVYGNLGNTYFQCR